MYVLLLSTNKNKIVTKFTKEGYKKRCSKKCKKPKKWIKSKKGTGGSVPKSKNSDLKAIANKND